jgi:heat shock protein HslJ
MTDPGAPFDGTEWRLVTYDAPAGVPTPVPDGILATAVFADGRVAGSTGCNRWSAPFEVDGSRLHLGPAAMTMMACEPDRTAVERGFTGALARVAGWSIEGHALLLLDADGRPILRFAPAASPALVGTRWVALDINNGRGGVASALAGVEVNAIFGADGRVTGSGGCNRFFGPYVADDEAISIGPLASTRMACAEPEGVMEQEAACLAALERVATWSIREIRLELRDADGALQVAFAPGEAV